MTVYGAGQGCTEQDGDIPRDEGYEEVPTEICCRKCWATVECEGAQCLNCDDLEEMKVNF